MAQTMWSWELNIYSVNFILNVKRMYICNNWPIIGSIEDASDLYASPKT